MKYATLELAAAMITALAVPATASRYDDPAYREFLKLEQRALTSRPHLT